MGLASRAQGARRRRCGDIVDDEQRRDRLATPMRPKGCGGAWASASLVLLDNVTTLPASRRLASAQAALATRHILILGQAPRLSANSVESIKQILSRLPAKEFVAWLHPNCPGGPFEFPPSEITSAIQTYANSLGLNFGGPALQVCPNRFP
jgi:hypothetical protein